MPKILFIAPLPGTESATSVVGGTKVLAAEQIRELRMRDFDLDILDSLAGVTNLPPWKRQVVRLGRLLRVLWQAGKRVRHSRIVFLIIASQSAVILATSIWIICAIARKPMARRFSGGDFGEFYRRYGALARWVADRTWMRHALVYIETRQMYRQFSNRANFRWFPNTRDIKTPAGRREAVRKLVFVSRLEMTKGLAEALQACRHLPEGCRLRVFGPAMPDTDFSLFKSHPRADYGGVLEPADVVRVLNEHDVLLFPSYFAAEGVPGIVVEAFQCGLPVIAAAHGPIAEIVEHERSGLLVEPRSATAITAAIERLLENPVLYRRLCQGAQRRGEDFRSPKWYGGMASDLRELCATTRTPAASMEDEYRT